MNKSIKELTDRIKPLDKSAMLQARQKQDSLTKPKKSLGRLEDLSIQLAGIFGRIDFQIKKKAIVIMASDHGVVRENVSLYPQEVTKQMVLNFLNGGAGINIIAELVGAEVRVVDIGIKGRVKQTGLINRKVRHGTNNIKTGPAMNRGQALEAILIGSEIAEQIIKRGCNLIGTGEMGIGNSTASSAVVSVLTSSPVEQITDRGTGLSNEMVMHKSDVIKQAIKKNRPDPKNPLDVLAKVGGLDIAGLTGLILGSAANSIPIIIDGFIAGAAALVAVEIFPETKDYLISSHLSREKGHKKVLKVLGLEPLLKLDLCLGEGTGAALAMNLVEAAALILTGMSTFESASVSRSEIG